MPRFDNVDFIYPISQNYIAVYYYVLLISLSIIDDVADNFLKVCHR